MRWFTKKKIKCVLICGIMISVLLSTSIITLADHIEKESNQSFADTVEVNNIYNRILPQEYLTNSNFDVNMLNEQLDNVNVINLYNDKNVEEYLNIDSKDVEKAEGQLISNIDNSSTKYFPPIGNQGNLSTCTTWSTVYYQMSYELNKQLNRDGKKEENIMSPYWVYSMINNGENSATYYTDALKILSEVGAVSIKTVPIETANIDILYNIKAKKENWIEARKNKVKEYYTVEIGSEYEVTPVINPQDESLYAIKKALASGEVLTATTYSSCWITEAIQRNDNVTENNKYLGEKIITRCDKQSYGAHRVTIVGYNDNIWVDINHDNKVQSGEKGAFKIADSYGEYKNNNGFIWMSYDAINSESSVDINLSYNLKSINRKKGLFAIVGFTVDTSAQDNNALLELEFTTYNAKSIQLNIKAENKETKEIYEYVPVPFSNSNLIQNVGYSNLNGIDAGGNKGVFCIDLSNVVKGIEPKDIDLYNWEISIMDAAEDSTTINVNKAKFYNAISGKYIDTSLEQPIELESTNVLITRGKDITKDDSIEINSEIYSFQVTDKEIYTFSTPTKYANKRYYDIYVLDEEYKDDLNNLANQYSATKTTKNGTVSMKIKKNKYVYCVANNKSAWAGFVNRNRAKLKISIN